MIKPGHRRVDREGPGEPLSSYGAVDRSIKKRTHFGRARGCFWSRSGPRSHVVGGRPCGWWSIVGGMPSHGCIDSSQIESLGGGKADVSNAPTATPQTAGCGPLPNRGWCRNSGRNEIGCGNRCRRRARRSSACRRAAPALWDTSHRNGRPCPVLRRWPPPTVSPLEQFCVPLLSYILGSRTKHFPNATSAIELLYYTAAIVGVRRRKRH